MNEPRLAMNEAARRLVQYEVERLREARGEGESLPEADEIDELLMEAISSLQGLLDEAEPCS